jgi:hypothetical protein
MSGVCHGGVWSGDGSGSHEEGVHRMLEGGNGTVGVGEGGLQMGEDLRRWPARSFSLQRGRQLRRRTPRRQCRANLALAQVEASPEALPGPVTEMAGGGTAGSDQASGDGVLEEAPQTARGQAEPSDFVCGPDADRPPATAPCLAVATKNPPCPDRLTLGVALVIAAQIAVANQRAYHLAVRTGHQLEPLRHRAPFLGAADKPSLLAHGRQVTSPKITDSTAATRCGVVAGYDKNLSSGVRGRNPRRDTHPRQSLLPNSRCNKHPRIGRLIGNIRPKMRSKRGKGHQAR